jgi:hypothetical protein
MAGGHDWPAPRHSPVRALSALSLPGHFADDGAHLETIDRERDAVSDDDMPCEIHDDLHQRFHEAPYGGKDSHDGGEYSRHNQIRDVDQQRDQGDIENRLPIRKRLEIDAQRPRYLAESPMPGRRDQPEQPIDPLYDDLPQRCQNLIHLRAPIRRILQGLNTGGSIHIPTGMEVAEPQQSAGLVGGGCEV